MRTLQLKVKPNARTQSLTQGEDGIWLAQLKSPPVDGKANAALLGFLAKTCGVSKSAVELISGDSSRAKRVRLRGADLDRVAGLAGD